MTNECGKESIVNRIEWIDFTKGITILLVIIGHTVRGILREAIFSFHMPLFFIFSCITFKYSISSDQFLKRTERAFKHLIIPAIVMFCLNTLIWCIINCSLFSNWDYTKDFIKERILIFVFSSGVSVQVLNTKIPAIGIPWFFVVLFLGRTLFDYLNLKYSNKKRTVICIILSIVGIALGKVQWLPLSFDIALAILPFCIVGKEFYKFNVEDKALKKFIISVLVWEILLLFSHMLTPTYMELAHRRYTLFPLCYVTAIAGTLMVSEFSVIVCKFKKISKPILYLGKNSLYMLCIHILDYSLLRPVWNVSKDAYINTICRVIVDVTVFILFMFVLEISKKYKKK